MSTCNGHSFPKLGPLLFLSGDQNVPGVGDDLQALIRDDGIMTLTNIAGGGGGPPRVCSNTFSPVSAGAGIFRSSSPSISTTNSTAAAVMIPLVILGFAVAFFLFRNPIRTCLSNSSGSDMKFMWISFALNIVVLILVMAAVISNHWSKTSGLFVGPWKTCDLSMDCADTLSAISESHGNVYAVRFFMVMAVFPAFALLALTVMTKLGKVSSARAATVSFWSLIFVGVATFTSMCVWAAFQYDTLAKFNALGSWSPDWALGLACLAWLFAFSSAVVTYIWKLKAMGGNDLTQAKTKSMDPSPTDAPATSYSTQPAPATSHHAPPPRTMPPPAETTPYSPPPPLNSGYGGEQQPIEFNQQYSQSQPGVDV